MEKSILAKLEWYLTVPTPYVFLVRYIKSSVPSDLEVNHIVSKGRQSEFYIQDMLFVLNSVIFWFSDHRWKTWCFFWLNLV